MMLVSFVDDIYYNIHEYKEGDKPAEDTDNFSQIHQGRP